MAHHPGTRPIPRDWNCPVIVAASGPSLSDEVAWECRKARWFRDWRIVAVNDAWRKLQRADVLYACDAGWWKIHNGAPEFAGERWTTAEGNSSSASNYKGDLPAEWRLNLVRGKHACTFSRDPFVIHYGRNSGFQAINLAILRGATRVVLVGFDMRRVDGKAHFFGEHPDGLCRNTKYENFVSAFDQAAKECKVPIYNATPGSALKCWPKVDLVEVLAPGWTDDQPAADGPVGQDGLLRGDRAEPDAATG